MTKISQVNGGMLTNSSGVTTGIFPPDKLYPPDYNYYFNNDPSKKIELKIKDNIGFKNPTSLIINFKQVGGEEKEIRAGQRGIDDDDSEVPKAALHERTKNLSNAYTFGRWTESLSRCPRNLLSK